MLQLPFDHPLQHWRRQSLHRRILINQIKDMICNSQKIGRAIRIKNSRYTNLVKIDEIVIELIRDHLNLFSKNKVISIPYKRKVTTSGYHVYKQAKRNLAERLSSKLDKYQASFHFPKRWKEHFFYQNHKNKISTVCCSASSPLKKICKSQWFLSNSSKGRDK